ncbi:MAG: autotransporter-associated beta strand repeat-containing protein [Verrucomicrobia bacterium]|nr:autotransporter-associated beta strand repeat-containing protein [Verrucomicrobiota bacterium]
MKSLNIIQQTRVAIKCLALAAAVGAGSVQAQTTHVGGNGVIGDEVLPTVAEGTDLVATVPRGGFHWTAKGQPAGGDSTSKLSSPVMVVPTTGEVTLKFTHRYSWEGGYDGGTVHISVNGASATYLPSAQFTANGYTATVPAPGNIPAFADDSPGYGSNTLIESVANLGTFNAADTVVVTFQGNWDDNTIGSIPGWEIGTVDVRDAADTAMLNVDFLNGSAGFTVTSSSNLQGPWVYLGPKSRFEIDGDALTADRYVPDLPGPTTIIDIAGADLEVVLLAGTLEPGDSFTLFDLTGGTTMRGTYGSITLPPGTWDLSNLGVTGTIVYRAESQILDFSFPTFGPATVNQSARTITKYVPDTTTVTALIADFTLSDGATCQVNGAPVVSGVTPIDFTNPVHYVVTGSDNLSTTTYTVTVHLVPVDATVIWNSGSGEWNTNSINWLGQPSGLPTTFADGANVIFDKPIGGTITVSSNMAPLTTTVSAASGTYTLSGGAIAGEGPLTKSGGGTLILSAANTYTGKTIIQAGTLQLGIYNSGSYGLTNAGVPGPLGAPNGAAATIDIHPGVTLQMGNTIPRIDQATDRSLNLAGTGAGTVTIRVNDNDTSFTFGAVTATGTGAKTLALFTGSPQGNGDREAVIFNGPISDSSDLSPTSLNVNFNTQTGSESYVSIKEGGTFTGPITLVRGANVNSAYLTVGGVRTRLGGTPGSGQLGGGNYAGNISLGTNTILDYFSSANQTLSGEITGAGKLTKGVAGSVLTLTGANSYTGITAVTAGKLLVNGTNSGTGAVNVAADATLGGVGTIGGATTLANNGRLAFTLSTVAASHDSLEISDTLVFSGASVLDITASGLLPAPGLYTLVSAAGGITGTAPATVNLPTGWAADVSISGNDLLLDVTSVGSTTGYATWAAANAGGQTADLDFNNDGVANGIAYFMGANGLATNPGVVNGKVAWPHSASATGIAFRVLTSQNLMAWTDVTADASDVGGFLTYTLPRVTPKRFVRLEVVAP